MKPLYVFVVLIALSCSGLLVETASAQNHQMPPVRKPAGQKNVAILIFDGVQMIDYTGPYEAFDNAMTSEGPLFNVYTVAEKPGATKANSGMSITPKYSFADVPRPDVVVIPGGMVGDVLNSPVALKWIQDQVQQDEITLSVCTGAFILAKANLLDGLQATTTAGRTEGLKKWAPKAKVVDDKRFVDAGKIITTSGGTSSIDGALHVIERIFGRGTAQSSALMMEYNWEQDPRWVRSNLADKYMSFSYEVDQFLLPDGWRSLSREGTVDRWENRWEVATLKPVELFESVNASILKNKRYEGPASLKWIKQNDNRNTAHEEAFWKFTDEKGAEWMGVVHLQALEGKPNHFVLSVKAVKTQSRQARAT